MGDWIRNLPGFFTHVNGEGAGNESGLSVAHGFVITEYDFGGSDLLDFVLSYTGEELTLRDPNGGKGFPVASKGKRTGRIEVGIVFPPRIRVKSAETSQKIKHLTRRILSNNMSCLTVGQLLEGFLIS
jgi:hypothetical protein